MDERRGRPYRVRVVVMSAVAVGSRLIAAVLVPGVLGVGSAHAALPSNCTQNGTDVTCRFASIGAPDQKFNVPAAVSSVNVVAVGAPGGAAGPRFPSPVAGGPGAVAKGTLNVKGGQTLYVEVGGAGGNGFDGADPGFNGGGPGDTSVPSSGGGGGASDVRSAPYSDGLDPDPRLLIAGGGGGAGGAGDPTSARGGAGGAAGQPGVGGTPFGSLGAGGGGLPGTTSAGVGGAGGGGGNTGGQAGSSGGLGGGGGGTTDGGGGGAGGGGLYGGGQGGEGAGNSGGNFAGGGGGGGGSSMVPVGGSIAANMTGMSPTVTISYQAAAGGHGMTKPKLRLKIAGARAVSAGERAHYSITLSRSGPRSLVKNVRVISRHGGHRVHGWRISALPFGQSRTLHLTVRVPRGASKRFCITTTASAKGAHGVSARFCARVATSGGGSGDTR